MDDYKKLEARLREWADVHSFSKPVRDAADAIRDLRAEVEALKAEIDTIADSLPGVQYMDPPDGGSPTLVEQFTRMATDARQVDALRQTLTSVRLAIVSVLCDHDERPCFTGTDGDRNVIAAAINDIDAASGS